MLMTNLKIRTALAENRMTIADLADVLGVSERTAFRKMRKEMSPEEQAAILTKIDQCVWAKWRRFVESKRTEAEHETDTENRRSEE